jgi:hypothetical protein
MEVLWWLVPPLAATCLAMLWAAWMGRERDDDRRDDSEAALLRMQRALAKPTPRKGRPVVSTPPERSHGVAVRGVTRRPAESPGGTRKGHDNPPMRRSSA